jgi:phosphohistidine phosphatase
VINFTAGLWSSVDLNAGSLSLFLTPKELKDGL